MSGEDWVEAAMEDDSAVVELLLHLHHSLPLQRKESVSVPALPLEWSVRQRRSKPMTLHAKKEKEKKKEKKKKKKKPTPRSSPTTPLSWSGGTSVSGGGGGGGGGAAADGFEESSQPPPKRSDSARSKVTSSGTTTNKRSRKKKTLTELKEEEVLLIKERRHLKRELATLRVTLEEQRTKNETLKRLKIDLESQPAVERVASVQSVKVIPDHAQPNVAPCHPNSSNLPSDVRIVDGDNTMQPPRVSEDSPKQQEVVNPENKFVLPDLNLPLDEESKSEVLHSVS